MRLTFDLPDELSAALATSGQDISRAALEAIAVEAFRERKLSAAQLRRLLGFETRYDLDGFLKQHQVWLDYTDEDLERDRAAQRNLESPSEQRPSLIQENGLLVHLGKAPRAFDWDRIVEDQRDERLSDVNVL